MHICSFRLDFNAAYQAAFVLKDHVRSMLVVLPCDEYPAVQTRNSLLMPSLWEACGNLRSDLMGHVAPTVLEGAVEWLQQHALFDATLKANALIKYYRWFSCIHFGSDVDTET